MNIVPSINSWFSPSSSIPNDGTTTTLTTTISGINLAGSVLKVLPAKSGLTRGTPSPASYCSTVTNTGYNGANIYLSENVPNSVTIHVPFSGKTNGDYTINTYVTTPYGDSNTVTNVLTVRDPQAPTIFPGGTKTFSGIKEGATLSGSFTIDNSDGFTGYVIMPYSAGLTTAANITIEMSGRTDYRANQSSDASIWGGTRGISGWYYGGYQLVALKKGSYNISYTVTLTKSPYASSSTAFAGTTWKCPIWIGTESVSIIGGVANIGKTTHKDLAVDSVTWKFPSA